MEKKEKSGKDSQPGILRYMQVMALGIPASASLEYGNLPAPPKAHSELVCEISLTHIRHSLFTRVALLSCVISIISFVYYSHRNIFSALNFVESRINFWDERERVGFPDRRSYPCSQPRRHSTPPTAEKPVTFAAQTVIDQSDVEHTAVEDDPRERSWTRKVRVLRLGSHNLPDNQA